MLEGTQGFVFELQQILRVKKAGRLEQGMPNLFRTRVEGAGILESQALGVGGGCRGHECKCIYAAILAGLMHCQDNNTAIIRPIAPFIASTLWRT